eukprot:1187747-Prorocentrum_minimum.AAC.1
MFPVHSMCASVCTTNRRMFNVHIFTGQVSCTSFQTPTNRASPFGYVAPFQARPLGTPMRRGSKRRWRSGTTPKPCPIDCCVGTGRLPPPSGKKTK